MNPLILIPARMASTRLPGKPLADICGLPMIVQVWKRAMESGVGRVVVACDGQEIADAVHAVGGEAVLTDPNHPSGSDRIWEALQAVDAAGTHDVIVNLQGDLPTLEPKLVQDVVQPLQDSSIDIATLAAVITHESEKRDPSIVKIAMGGLDTNNIARALYFSRAAVPYGDGPFYHHIGIYAYWREALQRFVGMPQGVLESREKLEQLRALEHGMTIAVKLADTVPLGVDTPEQLETARHILNNT